MTAVLSVQRGTAGNCQDYNQGQRKRLAHFSEATMQIVILPTHHSHRNARLCTLFVLAVPCTID